MNPLYRNSNPNPYPTQASNRVHTGRVYVQAPQFLLEEITFIERHQGVPVVQTELREFNKSTEYEVYYTSPNGDPRSRTLQRNEKTYDMVQIPNEDEIKAKEFRNLEALLLFIKGLGSDRSAGHEISRQQKFWGYFIGIASAKYIREFDEFETYLQQTDPILLQDFRKALIRYRQEEEDLTKKNQEFLNSIAASRNRNCNVM